MANGNESPHHVPDDHSLIGALARGACVLAGLALCFIAFGCYVMEAPPVSSSKMKHIQSGLPLAKVQSILGAPDHVNLRDDGSTYSWTYCPAFHWQIFYVYFDRDGKVTEAVLDR